MEECDLQDYLEPVKAAIGNYNVYVKHKPSKQNKFKESGLTMEQLHEEQLKLFAAAKIQKAEVATTDDMDIVLDDVQEETSNEK